MLATAKTGIATKSTIYFMKEFDCVRLTSNTIVLHLYKYFSVLRRRYYLFSAPVPPLSLVSAPAPAPATAIYCHLKLFYNSCSSTRVSEPAFFGVLRLREFFIRSRLRLLVKENIILEFLKTDYELSKTRSNTCTSTCRM